MNKIKNCYGYTVICPEEIAAELKEMMKFPYSQGINWNNFNEYDFYHSDNGIRYGVMIEGNTVVIHEE